LDHKRRGFLRAALGSTSLFTPMPWAWVYAQSEGAVKLLKAPKVALVIGNSKYKDAPELKNPANDAKGVGDALKAAGFGVSMKLDTGRDELIQAIRDYVNAMEKQKAVGLFYFAGHGVQLEWRNYMLPVDAVIDKIEDVAKQSVDIARLMEGLAKAANPMNVIILDACRENPFGAAKQAAKGLSQMDAPMNTILAYATSPGNVASDGEGTNGLYTENLLREMKQPEAKIEDVFKRVRLGVRRKTNGAQIPWESTSLEEDFWFQPPKELKKISEDEKERLFKEEAALWEKAKAANNAAAIEDYMRRYPSGNFAELAQLALDRLLVKQGEKKVVIASQEGNPYSKGTAAANTSYKVGDTYVYNRLDAYSKAVMETTPRVVEQVSDELVYYSGGLITDLMGNVRRFPDGRTMTDSQNIPLEFAVGKQWTTRYTVTSPKGTAKLVVDWKVTTRERITVPAGTFNCFLIVANGHGQNPMGTFELAMKNWYEPSVAALPIAREEISKNRFSTFAANRFELVSFKKT
jgi:uncharacterized caspase-like protein